MNPKQMTAPVRADALRSRPRSRTFQRSADLGEPEFPIAMRGYEREAVDEYIERVNLFVEELRRTRSAQGAVKEALDRVGEETSSILQRAHDTASEITSSAEGEARELRASAEQDAMRTRSAADAHARKLATDTQELWRERTALIDDVRRLAETLLEVADSSAERLPEPGIPTLSDAAMPPPPPPPGAETRNPPPPPPVDEFADEDDYEYDEVDDEELEPAEEPIGMDAAAGHRDERFVPPPERMAQLDRPTEQMDALDEPRGFRASKAMDFTARWRG